MKNSFYFITILFLFSCRNAEPKKSEIKIVTTQSTVSLESKQDTLTSLQIEKIKSFHTILEEVSESSLEVVINDFKKDPNADVEIAIWTRIAGSYKKCINAWASKPTLEMKKEIFQLMLNRSMTTDEEAIKSVKPILLSKKEIQLVLNFYNAEPNPFDAEQ